MKVLRMYGADVYAKDNNGKSAPALAKENNNSEIVIRIIKSYGVYE